MQIKTYKKWLPKLPCEVLSLTCEMYFEETLGTIKIQGTKEARKSRVD